MADTESPHPFQLGGLDVDPRRNTIERAGKTWSLEPKIMDVLALLAAHPAEVLSRESLIDQVWKVEFGADESLTRAVSLLRKTFREAGETTELIETIPKRGYRLTVTPTPLSTPTASGMGSQTAAAERPAAEAAAAAKKTEPATRVVSPTPPASKPRVSRRGLVAALAGLGVVLIAALWLLLPHSGKPPPVNAAAEPVALAVLPFDALSANEGDRLLAAGLSREIRNTLSRVRGLKVLADSSSLAAVAGKMSATDLGAKQWADLVVNGSFARNGDTVKLTAELVDAKTGVNVWAGEKSGPAADLDRLRELMSGALFQEIVARVGPNRLQQLAPPRSMDPRVYRLTLEAYQINSGLASLWQRGAEEEALTAGDRSDALLEEALAIEPDNAQALMLKGILQLRVSTHADAASGATLQDRLARAADFFRRAVASDPDNAEALVNLAENYRRNEWRWAEARPLFERALAVDPNSLYAHAYWSFYLSGAGRCIEALEQARIVSQLDPANKLHLAEARILKCLGKIEASDKIYASGIESDRANLFVLSEYYLSLLARRDVAALRELAHHVRDDLWAGQPSAPAAEWLARISEAADAIDGKPERFLQRLDQELRAFETAKPDENGRRGSDRYWTFALEYAHAGQTSHAIDLLGRALKEGSLYIPETMPYGAYEFTPEMRQDPRYQALWRSDPRLVELMRLRLDALKARQFTGMMPDGTRVDALPAN